MSEEDLEKPPLLTAPWATYSAFICTHISNVICVYLIVQHIRNYTQPGFQRYICRIIWIVPFYCTASWLALLYRNYSIYFETPRDCYEAWVIYTFMSLCMAYVGGPGAVVIKAEGKLIQPSWILCTCCMKPIPVDGFFLRNCKQGTLQFVIAKPFLAFFTLILFVMDKYQVGNWAFSDGYLYLAVIYNVCYSVALFWMLLFYVGTEELLKPYKPLLKFFVFKTVIFLTFWQGLVVTFLATRFGWTPDDSEALQNWLICVEMFFAAIGMFFAFPHSEYQLGGAAAPGWTWKAFSHAVSIQDAIEDIMFQFNPDYKSYVLHTDGGPSENVKRKKFRGKKKKNQAFSIIVSELGAVTEKMKKLRPGDKLFRGVGRDKDNDGGEWHSAARKDNMLTHIQGGMEQVETGAKKLVAWIPGITELERRQAELLDSDSDAEYDEENQKDNQFDHDVLASSSSDGDPSVRPRGGRAGHGIGRGGRRQALNTQGSSDEEDGGTGSETGLDDGRGGRGMMRGQQNAGGRVPNYATSDSDGPGNYGWQESGGKRGRKAGAPRQSYMSRIGERGGGEEGGGRDDWAQFPDAHQMLAQQSGAEDDSWADFGTAPPPASVTPKTGTLPKKKSEPPPEFQKKQEEVATPASQEGLQSAVPASPQHTQPAAPASQEQLAPSPAEPDLPVPLPVESSLPVDFGTENGIAVPGQAVLASGDELGGAVQKGVETSEGRQIENEGAPSPVKEPLKKVEDAQTATVVEVDGTGGETRGERRKEGVESGEDGGAGDTLVSSLEKARDGK